MMKFNPELYSYCTVRLTEIELIVEKRKKELRELSSLILEQLVQQKEVKLNFICTHNSRRSHFGQIWSQTASYWYGLKDIWTYSGGTEATAFNKRSVAALIRAGFIIENASDGINENPVYSVKQGEDFRTFDMFSKKYGDDRNPSEQFIAIMVCSDADENCPIILGADHRFSITYEDPKVFDGSEDEARMYDERCAQIAREMFYLFSIVNEDKGVNDEE